MTTTVPVTSSLLPQVEALLQERGLRLTRRVFDGEEYTYLEDERGKVSLITLVESSTHVTLCLHEVSLQVPVLLTTPERLAAIIAAAA